MRQIYLDEISKSFKIYKRKQSSSVISGLFKRETEVIKALDKISFSLDEGELVGCIGPNGAGKSTTVKVMSGILTPDSGCCEILGRVPWKQRVLHVMEIGVVFGQRSQLWWDVPVCDSFNLLKDIYNLSEEAYKKRFNALIDTMGISTFLKTPVRQLSLGQRMRCEIAAALLHSPKILFLDEPTIGLDAVSKLALRDFLKEENKKNGVTMILTTHDMDDIEALCEKVMVIGHGKILYNGGLDSLKKRYATLRRIRAQAENSVGNIKIDGAVKIEVNKNSYSIWFDPDKIPAHIMVSRIAEKLPLTDIIIEESNIDEIIANMYREMEI